jgi:Bacterial regulatory proteins, luxR family
MLRSEYSVPEIAAHLNVSYNTGKTHTRAIYRKLGVGSRSAAVARAASTAISDLVRGTRRRTGLQFTPDRATTPHPLSTRTPGCESGGCQDSTRSAVTCTVGRSQHRE